MTPERTKHQTNPLQTIFLNLGLALLYFTSGKIGLLLNIPPGYATAFWPASGFALAGLLLYGHTLWPGILIGSFLINFGTSLGLANTEDYIQPVLFAIGIGIGATLQALAGVSLINRYINTKSGLLEARNIVLFMALGGPLSCLISAGWGVTVLWLMGHVSIQQYPYNFMTWWLGDSTGVLIVVPLLLIWFGQPRKAWEHRKTSVAIPLVGTLALVIIVFILTSNQEQKRIESEFRAQSLLLGDALEKKLVKSIEVLYSIHSLFNTTEFVTRDQFKSYVQRAIDRNPSIQAVGWNPVVTMQQRTSFEKMVQAQGFTDFVISERNSDGKQVPAATREKYVVVKYITPLKGNEKALGYDIYSNPARKKALDAAAASGKLVATAAIKLVQETGNQTGILFMLPVYKGAITPPASQREQMLRGYVVGVYRMGELLSDALNDYNMANIIVSLEDRTNPESSESLVNYSYNHQGHGSPLDLAQVLDKKATFYLEKKLNFGQRIWTFNVQATPEYLTQHRSWLTWTVLTTGLLFSTLLGIFLLILTGQAFLDQRRANHLAREIKQRKSMERALHNVNQQLNKLSKTDPLTQINNRRSILEIGKGLDAESKRYQTRYSVIMLDIDHFKQVNDRLGHHVGDEVLQQVVTRLRSKMRDTDHIGRWGGEDFIILSRLTRLQETIHYAQRLRQAVCDTEFDAVGRITISIGVSSNDPEEEMADVIKRADKALYMAKHNGRNRVESLAA